MKSPPAHSGVTMPTASQVPGYVVHRKLFALSRDADRARLYATLLLSLGAELATPITAVGVAMLVTGLARTDEASTVTGLGLVAASTAFQALNEWGLLGVRARLRESVDGLVDQKFLAASTLPPTIDHLENPAIADRIAFVNENRAALGNAAALVNGFLAFGLSTVATLVLLFRVSPWLLALPLAALVPWFAAGEAQRRLLSAQARIIPERRSRAAYLRLATDPHFASELRVTGAGPYVQDAYERRHEEMASVLNQASWSAMLFRLFGSLFFVASLVAALAVASAHTSQKPGEVALVLFLGMRLTAQVALGVGLQQSMARSLLAGRAFLMVESLADTSPIHTSRPQGPTESGELTPGRPPPVVELSGVSFAYPARPEEMVLRNVSLILRAGSVTALVGENGAGKSSLVKLLCELYVPSEGTVWCAETLPGGAVRTACFQDFERYEFSVREGLMLAAQGDDSAELRIPQALKDANAERFTDELPDGLDTTLGRRFTGSFEISGGSWQKLALARAFMVPSPRLIILDEPGSGLDPETEEMLIEAVLTTARSYANAGCAVLVVSHRLSTVTRADHILVFDEGRLIESGTHPELMSSNRTYQRMYGEQRAAFLTYLGEGP